jgi:hypothetical protein
LPLLRPGTPVDAHGGHAASLERGLQRVRLGIGLGIGLGLGARVRERVRVERGLQRVEHLGVVSEDQQLGAARVTVAPGQG